ncbi:hypothetical protein A3K73_00280 [Candidatus Pacearchaeota archaeon RBG_13_36_9]|nr:MAG: hypothetical protein A3K73_00280 [Candidatus Pacearchaeota archaeon RBG_13_36_9]
MINEINIIGSGKSKFRILSLDQVLMTPEQIIEHEREEERKKNEQRNTGKPPTTPKKPSTPSQNAIVPGEVKIYDGRNVDKAPEILNAGKIIAPFFYIAQNRISAKSKKDIGLWVDKWFDVSDLILYNDKDHSEDIKIVLAYDAKYNLTPAGKTCLEMINPAQTLVNGGVNISGLYSDVDGDGVISTTRSELAKVLEDGLTKVQAKDSKLWKMLLRHPDEVAAEFAVPGLHEEYINWVYSAYGSRFAKEKKLMGVYLASPKDVPHLREWFVNMLEYRSDAIGWNYLDNDYGRFAGISARGAGQKK